MVTWAALRPLFNFTSMKYLVLGVILLLLVSITVKVLLKIVLFLFAVALVIYIFMAITKKST